MQGITNSALLDVLQTTIANLPDEDFEVALKYRNYEVINRWFQKDRMQIDGGTEISRRLSLKNTGAAAHVLPFEKRAVNIVNTFSTIKAGWVYGQTYYAISRKEMLQNMSKPKLITLVKARRMEARRDKCDMLQERAWLAPNSLGDGRSPNGVPYYLRMANSGITAGGFVGQTVRFGDASTSTLMNGLDLSTDANARARNYADIYTEFNSDLVKRMRKAWLATHFEAPVTVEDMKRKPFTEIRIYMGLDNAVNYEDLATAGNDNIGSDLFPFGGSVSFKRTPIVAEAQLDNAAFSPIYGINHTHFYPVVLSGEFFREGEPMTDMEQPDSFVTFYDSAYQYFDDNPKEAGFVLHTVTNV